MNDVTERFITVYNYHKNLKIVNSASEFAKKISISSSMMNEILKGRSNVGVKALQNTVLYYSIINADWLLTGFGRMERPSEALREKLEKQEDCSKIKIELFLLKETVQEQKSEIRTLTKEVGVLEDRILRFKKEYHK